MEIDQDYIKKLNKIKNNFKIGELSFLTAIEEVEKLGYTPTDAEELVIEWDETK